MVLKKIVTQMVSQNGNMFNGAVVEKLLNHIVAVHVFHESIRMGEDFRENSFFFRESTQLQLLLDEAAAVLVAAELNQRSEHLGQLKLFISIIPQLFQ